MLPGGHCILPSIDGLLVFTKVLLSPTQVGPKVRSLAGMVRFDKA